MELSKELIKKITDLLEASKNFGVDESEGNIFDTCMRGHYENPTTELLSFFLEPQNKHKLGSAFYNGFKNLLAEYDDEFENIGDILSIETEVTTNNNNRIDLVLKTDFAVILVECKIYHEQNNPFSDYESYGESLCNDNQKLYLLVLSIDGETEQKNWFGMGYDELADSVESELAISLVKNPYNKWGLFAREFLMHLRTFYETEKLDMESIDFVIDNMKAITDLQKLQGDVYGQIIDYITVQLEKNIQNYERHFRRHTWQNQTPAFRFCNYNWTHWTEVVLHLKTNEDPMSCSVIFFLDYQTSRLVNQYTQKFSEQVALKIDDTWLEQKDRFWGVRWEFEKFDLDQLTDLIVQLVQIANQTELNRKEKEE